MAIEYTRYTQTGGKSKHSLRMGGDYNNPESPSYTNPEYREVLPMLDVSNDIFQGATAWVLNGEIKDGNKAARYLPRETKERPPAYTARLLRSLFVNFYKPTIKGFSGLLSDFSLNDGVLPSIAEFQDNINLQGDSLAAFLCACDELVLRDGFCGILVDFPRMPTDEDGKPIIRSLAQEREFALRPYLVSIERKDILNWRTTFENGALRLEQITIKRCELVPEGRFGSKHQTTYHCWYPGGYEIWQEPDDGEGEPFLVDEVEISLQTIPIVLYSVVGIDPFCTRPPLYDLALENISHYQLYSDYREVLHKCNLPVPVRKGFIGSGSMDVGTLPPIVIGPNTAIDIPKDGDFFFAEPTGSAISATRQAIIDLEAAMLREAVSFFGTDDTEKTAREVELRSSQTRATLGLMAQMKESAIEQVFSYWAQWLNQGTEGGTIEVNKSLLQSPLTPQAIQVFSGLVSLGQIDLRTFIEILKTGKAIPKQIDVQDIVSRLGMAARTVQELRQSNEVLNGDNEAEAETVQAQNQAA